MTRNAFWVIFVLAAISIGVYPLFYLFIDQPVGLLTTKSTGLLADPLWKLGFYTHILAGGMALLIGWTQFHASWRARHLELHRLTGKAYLIAVCMSSLAGIYIGFFATGGLISSLGFISLGLIWFLTTTLAYRAIRHRQVVQHQRLMIVSYAACFSAVTLRIELPLLIWLTGDFETAYRLVAWLCWVPNILVAWVITRQDVISTQAH